MRSLRPLTLARLSLSPLAAALAAAFCLPALAQSSDGGQSVVVTGSVREQRVLDAPFAITSVDAGTLRDAGPMINLSEALARVPGLVVANRNNYAQDLQISSRGFGARATFGVRGMRLYTDGIPASMPDGQGQVAHFDLAGAQRIEVLRGPFSVLYGNSSGGVIALFSAPVRQASFEAGLDAGSFGLRQERVSLATPLSGNFDLKASLSNMTLDGFRPQSEAERQLANVRLGWRGEQDTVVVLANAHHQKALDPLGLKPEDFAANPRATTPEALEWNTRKTIVQEQLGVNWRHRFADMHGLQESSLSLYTGHRSVTQFLAIPAATQANVRHGGGVVDFDRHYDGVEARLSFGGEGVNAVLGWVNERQVDARRGFENYSGPAATPTAKGVFGNPRRDETNLATTQDLFLQGELALAPSLALTAGVRSGQVNVEVRDRYVKGLNGDDSGRLSYEYTNPVLGLRWRATPTLTLHASAALGFESPTLGELAYTADNSGFNKSLKGQGSRQLELGAKHRGEALSLDAALFLVNTSDEIGVATNAGGRSAFQNVGHTQRYGAEASLGWRITPSLRAQASASVLHAQYEDSFTTCIGAPCPVTPNANRVSVAAGNRIAGTQKALAWAELAWRPGLLPGELALEVRGQAKTAANDTNSVFAPGYGLVNLRWSKDWALGSNAEWGTLQTLVRLDNAANRAYVGSVIVNDANGRFFEPGTPRNWLLSLRWARPI
jgi:iron complex outermembrane receptor protein